MIKDNFSKQRRRALASWLGCVAVVFCCGAAGGALGQAYPARPIRLLLPYGPGGNSDIAARVLAQKLSESMRQQVIIDNRPGAGGIVATELARKAEPDGYTLLWLNAGHAVSVSLYKSLPYDPVRDFAPVSAVGFAALALLVNADSPLRSVTALVAFAKANPGKFNIGVTFVGSTNHVSAELFKSMAGLETQVVPFKTTPALIAGVSGNEAQAIFEFIAPVLPHIKSGALRALGVTSDRRYAGLPDVPTLAEALQRSISGCGEYPPVSFREKAVPYALCHCDVSECACRALWPAPRRPAIENVIIAARFSLSRSPFSTSRCRRPAACASLPECCRAHQYPVLAAAV